MLHVVSSLKELLHLSKTLKSQSLTTYLKEEISKDKSLAQNVLNDIELTKLDDIIKSICIYYDPDDKNTNIKEDKELLQIYQAFSGIDNEINNENCNSKWIIRIEVDKEKMMYKNINMELLSSNEYYVRRRFIVRIFR